MQESGRLRILDKVAILLLGLAALLGLLAPLTVRQLGFDGFLSLQWIDGYSKDLFSGVLPPHWLPDAYGGLGAPTFYFYPPLAFAAASLVRLVLPAAQTLTIYHVTGLFATLGSLFTFRAFARTLSSDRKTIWMSSLFYAFAPFRLYPLYTRSMLSEHCAFVWIPLLFLFTYELLHSGEAGVRRSRAMSFAGLAIAWTLLLVTHISTSLIAGILLALYLLISSRSKLSKVVAPAIAIVLGTMIAGFYLLPIPYFKPFAQLEHLVLSNGTPSDILLAVPLLLRGFDYTESFLQTVCYLGLFATTCTLWYAWRSQARSTSLRRWILAFAVMGTAAIFFENTTISGLLWRLLNFTQLIQFPWRWNVLALFIVASAVAALQKTRYRQVMLVVLIAWSASSVLLATLLDFNLRVHPRAEQRTPYDAPEYVPHSTFGTPDNVIAFARATEHDPFVLTVAGENLPQETTRTPAKETVRFTLNKPTRVVFHQWYWPSWILRDERGRVLPQQPDSTGRASALLDAGAHTLTFTLVPLPIEITGRWVSLAGCVLLVLSMFFLRRVGNRSSQDSIAKHSVHPEPQVYKAAGV